MARHNIGDILQAQGMSVLSFAGQRFPSLRDYFAAPRAPSGYHVPLRWRYSGQDVNSVPRWVKFQADAQGGRIAKSYNLAGIVQVDKAELDVLDEKFGNAREAVAFQLGTAVMVGVAEQERNAIFALDPEDERRYAVAMRIGTGPLLAAAGVWVESLGFLGVNNTNAGGRVSVKDVPPTIPIV